MLRLHSCLFLMALLPTSGLASLLNARAQGPAQSSAQTPAPAPTGLSSSGQSGTPAANGPQAASPAAASVAKPADPETVGDADTARQRYQAALAAYASIPKKTAAVWNKMGIDYQLMLNPNDAVRCYQNSIKINPNDAGVLNNLATVYGSMKNYGAADRMYRKAIKVDPKSALIIKNYGTNLLTEHKYQKGWQEYQRALRIDPSVFAEHDGPFVQNEARANERGAMNYYMAVGCARAGYTDCALQYLRNALDEGYTSPKKVAADSDFASLRANPEFKQMLAEQEQRHQ